MASECLVIFLLIGGLCVGFFRAKRKNWALAVLPLAIIPFVVGAVMLCCTVLFHVEYSFILPMTLTLVSLAASFIWIGIASAILIKTKRLRIYYIVVAVGFDFVLSLILLIRYYNQFRI